jgi:phosphatidate cytidylyltransferase
MAFHWQTFRTRALTAIIFAGIMLAGLLWNQWSFLLLFSVIHFGCWWEYFKLVEKIRQTTFHIYTRLGFMLMGYGGMLWFCNAPEFVFGGYEVRANFSLPFTAAGFILLLVGIFQKNRIDLKSFGLAALGLFYISLSWGLLMSMYGAFVLRSTYMTWEMGKYTIPVAIIASIWINDTMAYIVGSLIGKRPLSKISPKKTWEGTIGGIILSIAAIGFVFSRLFSVPAPTSFLYLFCSIAGIAAITGTFGDLLESKLKRMAGVKDSGHIMPGHGGFMDRFDSLLIAIPFVWLFFWALVK